MIMVDHDDDGRAGLPAAERTRGVRLARLIQFLITALLVIVLAATVGLWGWAAWWGVSKLIGLLF